MTSLLTPLHFGGEGAFCLTWDPAFAVMMVMAVMTALTVKGFATAEGVGPGVVIFAFAK